MTKNERVLQNDSPPSDCSDFVRVASIIPFWRYAVGPTSQNCPAIPYWTLKGAEKFFAEVKRHLPSCGARIYKRTRRGLVTVREYRPKACGSGRGL